MVTAPYHAWFPEKKPLEQDVHQTPLTQSHHQCISR